MGWTPSARIRSMSRLGQRLGLLVAEPGRGRITLGIADIARPLPGAVRQEVQDAGQLHPLGVDGRVVRRIGGGPAGGANQPSEP